MFLITFNKPEKAKSFGYIQVERFETIPVHNSQTANQNQCEMERDIWQTNGEGRRKTNGKETNEWES